MKYTVELAGTASVTTSIEVEAESEEQASAQALEEARSGNVIWRYNEMSEDENQGIEVTEVSWEG